MQRAMGCCLLWGPSEQAAQGMYRRTGLATSVNAPGQRRTGGVTRGMAMHPSLLIIFGVAVVLRLGSLALSIRNEQALKAQGSREYGQRTSRHLALAHTLFYLGALAEGLWRGTQPTPWTTVGLILYGLSVLAFVLVWRALYRLWTVKLLIASDHVLNQSALFRWVR